MTLHGCHMEGCNEILPVFIAMDKSTHVIRSVHFGPTRDQERYCFIASIESSYPNQSSAVLSCEICSL